MAFQVIKQLDLSYLGEGWGGTYIKFTGLTFAETREFANLDIEPTNPEASNNLKSLDMVLNIVQKHFVSGSGWNGKQIVEMKAEDLADLPVEVITRAVELLAGNADPKS